MAWDREGAERAAVTRPLPWEPAALSGSGAEDPVVAGRPLPACRLPLSPASGSPCRYGGRSQATGRQGADAAPEPGPVSCVLSQGPFAALLQSQGTSTSPEQFPATRGSPCPAPPPRHRQQTARSAPAPALHCQGPPQHQHCTAWSQLPRRPRRLPHPGRLRSEPQCSSWPPTPPPPLLPPAPLPLSLPPFRPRPQPRPRPEPQPRPLPCQPRPRPGPRPRRPSRRYDAAQLHPDFRGAAVRCGGAGHLPRPARQRRAPALPTWLPPLRPRLWPHLPGPGWGHVPGAAQP